jgi:hypothetical protein
LVEPIPVRIEDATFSELFQNEPYAIEYLQPLLRMDGPFRQPGGYRVTEGGEAADSDATVLYCDPIYVEEAQRLRRFFPGAEIRSQPPSEEHIRVVVGRDFVRRNEGLIHTYGLVDTFMERRLAGTGAESWLSTAARDQYEQGVDGISLYGYTVQPGTEYEISSLTLGPGGHIGDGSQNSYRAVVGIHRPGFDRYEALELAKGNVGDGVRLNPAIVYVEQYLNQ